MRNWLKRRAISSSVVETQHRLPRVLRWWHLVALGVGGIVGTGIYTLVGIAAGLAGPAVLVSFSIAGAICACVALAYAEVAAMLPTSGSAYAYTYMTIGQVFAWIVGWSLILEYSLVVSAVAVGWSGYATGFLSGIGVPLPIAIITGPDAGGIFNVPAVLIIMSVAFLLFLGTRESAVLNAVLVTVKLVALIMFVAFVVPHFKLASFRPLMPYGFTASGVSGTPHGVMAAAAIIFFAFYGFDAVSTASEEARNPARDLPIGIIGSFAISAIIYIAVAAAAVGSMPFTQYANSAEPLAFILRRVNSPTVAAAIEIAAALTMPTVILAMFYGQTRVFFAMARDGLLPKGLALVQQGRGTPLRIILITTIVVSLLAGFIPLRQIAALANAGTLLAFVAVCVCLLVLRHTERERVRPFRLPFAYVLAPIGILGCVYLFFSLPQRTQMFFAIWNAFGLVLFAIKSRPAE